MILLLLTPVIQSEYLKNVQNEEVELQQELQKNFGVIDDAYASAAQRRKLTIRPADSQSILVQMTSASTSTNPTPAVNTNPTATTNATNTTSTGTTNNNVTPPPTTTVQKKALPPPPPKPSSGLFSSLSFNRFTIVCSCSVEDGFLECTEQCTW